MSDNQIVLGPFIKRKAFWEEQKSRVLTSRRGDLTEREAKWREDGCPYDHHAFVQMWNAEKKAAQRRRPEYRQQEAERNQKAYAQYCSHVEMAETHGCMNDQATLSLYGRPSRGREPSADNSRHSPY